VLANTGGSTICCRFLEAERKNLMGYRAARTGRGAHSELTCVIMIMADSTLGDWAIAVMLIIVIFGVMKGISGG
jgi:hypothetical protein